MSEEQANYFPMLDGIEDETARKIAILKYENHLMSGETIDLDVHHHRSPGIYTRTVVVEKGVTVTGNIHITEHLTVIVGDVEIADHNGSRRLTGYHIIASEPGIKRCVYAYEDTIFTTIHAVYDGMSINEIENSLFVSNYEEYEQRRLN